MRAMALASFSLALSLPFWASFPFRAFGAERPWNQFRGPDGNGQTTAVGLPVQMGESLNVRWKTAVPGKAWSSPVVWGDRVWVTNATEDGTKLSLLAVNLESGQIVHDLLVFPNPGPQYCHPLNSYATSTPVIEDGRIYVHYGAHGTACVDTNSGKTLWSRRDLPCNHFRGPASSPALYGNLLYILFDGYDQQYVVALNKDDGTTAWKRERAFEFGTNNGDAKKAYGTPTLIEHGGRPQLICPAAVATEAFDPRTGDLLWTVRHGGMNASARPLYGHGLAFVSNGMGDMLAIRPEGSGDITKEKVVWKSGKQIPKKSSMLLLGDYLYMVADNGVASCVDAKTGDIAWSQRLGNDHAASPLFAEGRIYFFSQEGDVRVVKAAPEFKLLAEGKFESGFMASPAVAGKSLVLRSKTHLYRVEQN